ncbi:hypothetical protein [Micromonospora marina]|uniref:hypothetical protein n=1 Tax=Micromonospora marina TaxID=307120 RepID=UPI0034526311
MPDPIFSELYRDTEHLTWAPTEQVRGRARRRARRTRLTATLAAAVAVGVIATGAVALAGRPDATPPPVPPATVDPTTPAPAPTPSRSTGPTPSGSPSRAPSVGPSTTSDGTTSRPPSRAIPAAAMLQLADLPAGFRREAWDGDGDGSLESVGIYCRNQLPATMVKVVATRFVSFASPADVVSERVTRHAGSFAETEMQRVRQRFTQCQPHQSGDSFAVVAESLGGDDAVLVASEVAGLPSRWLVVRQGDLVAQVSVRSTTTPAEALRLARSVANRLCAGTDTC